jgi:putative transport protein
MSALFLFLQKNPYLLLFLVVGLAVWIGRVNVKGYGLGMVAGAIIVGAGLSVWASMYGAKLELNNFAKSLFYYLFMYGVGLRVGPSFINSLNADSIKFSALAVISCVIGLVIIVSGVKICRPEPRAASWPARRRCQQQSAPPSRLHRSYGFPTALHRPTLRP